VKTNRKKAVRYSLTIKQQVLRRILSGELSINAAAREYGIKGSMTIPRWLNQQDELLGTKMSQMADSPDQEKSKDELVAEIRSVRQLLDQERLRSEAYLAMIKLAEEQFQIPIEKKSGAKPSSK
jgi:transposase-like protein